MNNIHNDRQSDQDQEIDNLNKDGLEEAEELASRAEQETKQLETLESEVANLKDQWMRAMAETENLRQRAQRDREDALKYASSSFARDMLSIADNLHRALQSCPPEENLPDTVKALISGVEMTEKELLTTFERHGIQKIVPLNEKFDPHRHQAMFEIEQSDQTPGTVVQVLQSGYIMHDRLLRPAMVAVAKSPSAAVDKKNQPPENTQN